jgi:hypothetical protein
MVAASDSLPKPRFWHRMTLPFDRAGFKILKFIMNVSFGRPRMYTLFYHYPIYHWNGIPSSVVAALNDAETL